ncbi:MAG: hypothetical protein M1827_005879 [Pycnora praestabilis]|nr:MAG: hypothetical protein M1827_005879 [Pycnora praestabilis]
MDKTKDHDIVHAHGLIMALAFVIFFPLGALTIRLLSFPGLIWLHAGAQIFAYIMAIAGVGLGIWWAKTSQQLDQAHPIIGLVVFSLLFFQPFLALVHHQIYKKEHRRTVWAWAHIWWGRALIILGVINGGLGLQLSGNTVKGEIAYGVLAGIMFVVYVGVILMAYLRPKNDQEGETGEKIGGSHSPANSQAEVMEKRQAAA